MSKWTEIVKREAYRVTASLLELNPAEWSGCRESGRVSWGEMVERLEFTQAYVKGTGFIL